MKNTITASEVALAVNILKTGKAADCDEIQPVMLKALSSKSSCDEIRPEMLKALSN